jgi:FemAB-related protein (PEP-CTERM system-associated)
MDIKLLDIYSNCSAWDEYVKTHESGTVYQMSGWGRAIHKSMKHGLYYIYVEDDAGLIQGVFPLVHVASKLFGKSLISVAFSTGGGPLYRDQSVLKMMDDEAIRISRSLNVGSLESRGPSDRTTWAVKENMYSSFRKELSSDNEENMLAIPRKQRAMVRKGIKFGLKAEIDDDVSRIYALYAESVRNLGTPVFPKSLFIALKEEFKEDCEILTVVTAKGKPISSVMSFYFKDEIAPYYGGGSVEARHFAANDFMYWAVMEHAACTRGTKVFDFGRSKDGTGAYKFKKNWGFEPAALNYEFYLEEGQEIPEINPLNPKYQLMIKVWRKLPLPIANFIGPFISKSLG